ncbi:MAG: phosphoglycerate mutase family protein [Pseudomonadota bacterium]
MARLFIVRHGNTFDKGDTILRVGGRTDLSLSTSGELQATALGARFAELGIAPARIIAGPLKRTVQTATAISDALGGPAPVMDERLREIDYGPDEGKPEEDVIARTGREAMDAWEREARVPDGWRVDTSALVDMWKDQLAALAETDEDIMAVTSNGIARFVLQVIPTNTDVPLKLRTGAYGVIERTSNQVHLTEWDVRP